MMKQSDARGARKQTIKIIRALKKKTKGLPNPAATNIIEKYGRDSYLILISCILSLRTRDTTSFPASVRLFKLAKTPRTMLKLTKKQIEKAIYPVGFYKQKAKQIHSISKDLIEQFKGKVPKKREELLSMKGVGPKTASLVLAEAFSIPAICVDTHVQRLSNKPHFGIVNTKTPEATEEELMKVVPKKDWKDFNRLVVMWGQNVCKPGKTCKCKELEI